MNAEQTPAAAAAEKRSQIIGALFEDVFLAERAAADLRAYGLTRVQVSSVEDPGPPSGDGTEAPAPGVFFEDHDLRASRFVDELTNLGFVPRDANYLVGAVVGGKTLVTADVEGAMTAAMLMLRPSTRDIRYGAASFTPHVDVDERAVSPEIIGRAARFAVPPAEPLPEPQPIADVVAETSVGDVVVRRETVEETRTITVTLRREDLVVERVVAGNAVELKRVTLTRDEIEVRTIPTAISDLLDRPPSS
jgi:hypothetical protein